MIDHPSMHWTATSPAGEKWRWLCCRRRTGKNVSYG
jgi:hypothetical protein